MDNNLTDWVVDKLKSSEGPEIVDRTSEDYLIVRSKVGNTFVLAVLGVRDVIELSDVDPLFSTVNKPELVINVPSKALWRGAAIDHIHAASAAFGKFGDVSRAADIEDAGSFRNKSMAFFINAIEQHTNVAHVSYIYDTVLKVDCRNGASLTVAVVDAYNMSAEDVRNAKARLGHFDIVVKSTSYGSITTQAEEAAHLMGAQALKFRGLMSRLAR